MKIGAVLVGFIAWGFLSLYVGELIHKQTHSAVFAAVVVVVMIAGPLWLNGYAKRKDEA